MNHLQKQRKRNARRRAVSGGSAGAPEPASVELSPATQDVESNSEPFSLEAEVFNADGPYNWQLEQADDAEGPFGGDPANGTDETSPFNITLNDGTQQGGTTYYRLLVGGIGPGGDPVISNVVSVTVLEL
jgi:hypothetical protein